MDWDFVVKATMSLCFGLMLRSAVSLNSYSGEGKPPMYGDYEAQRHWMEITHNLPVDQWYNNTKDNDLLYWGLDYPPLTAYHSKLCGYIASLLNKDWVALHTSRGYESYDHKLFMRYTVILADIFTYMVGIIWFYRIVDKKSTAPYSNMFICGAVLSYPGLILIDHGHFQYNCISLGLACFAVCSLLTDRHFTGAVFFTLALNYKQMELYHALPFFCYLLGVCWKQNSWLKRIEKLASIGLAVIATFIICWLPFLTSVESTLQVLHRLFPFNRGLYEDKVANFWCSLSVAIKLNKYLSQTYIVKLCLCSTLLACLPSSIDLLRFHTKKKFLYSLVNCSLAFFLFSFQVHEKSILIVALPVCLVLLDSPNISRWFLLVSTISMYPLLERDGQSHSYIVLLCLFAILVCNFIPLSSCGENNILVNYMVVLSMFTAVVLHACQHFIPPPDRYPYLYAQLFAIYGCAHFLPMMLCYNYIQWNCDQSDVSLDRLFVNDDKQKKTN